jgi:hypothetical protein
MERRALERPDLLVIGFDPMAFDLAMGAAALGARVVFAGAGDDAVSQSIRDGLLIEQLAAGLKQPGRAAFESLRREMVASIRTTLNPARIAAARASVVEGPVRFISRQELEAGDRRFRPRRLVLARGRAMPDMPAGLVDLLGDGVIPQRVILAGRGALLVTLAHLLIMAGSKVSVVAEEALLGDFDPDGARLMQEHLERAGVSFLPERPAVRSADWPLWVIEPLRPHLGGLALESAGFREPSDPSSVADRHLRLKGFPASLLGSILEPECGAGACPGMVGYLLAQLLFRKGGTFRASPVPRAVGVVPHLCEIGQSEAGALTRHGQNIRILRMHAREAGFAGAEGVDFLKLVTTRRGALLGASAFGPAAREQMALLSLAIDQQVPVSRLAEIPALPLSTAALLRATAAMHAREQLRSPNLQRLVRWLRLLG